MASGKERICDAYLSLATTMDSSKVTVTAIIQKAQINRSSFYYHFHTTSDIVDYLIDSFASKVKETYGAVDPPNGSTFEEVDARSESQIDKLDRFIYEKRNAFSFLRESSFKARFYDALVDAICEGVNQFTIYFKTENDNLHTLPQLEKDYYVHALAFVWLSIWDQWAATGFNASAQDISKLTHAIASNRLSSVERSNAFPKLNNIGVQSLIE